MFTRRVLFKMLAAIGAGSLLLTVGEGEVPRLSGIGEALSFGSSVRPDGSPATLGEQAVDVTAIEQWEDLLDDLDGVELIGRYTPLTRAKDASCGIMGRCPFCRHGTDLFLVDGRDDSYFCTECLAGGHALDFYARMEEVSLSESVRPVMGLLVSGQLQGKSLDWKDCCASSTKSTGLPINRFFTAGKGNRLSPGLICKGGTAERWKASRSGCSLMPLARNS